MTSPKRSFIQKHGFACWCGENAAGVYCSQMFGTRFVVLRCNTCGTHRILPRAIPTAGAAVDLYNAEKHTRARMAPSIAEENASRIFQRIARVGIKLDPAFTVVDIGCSEGLLLEKIRTRFGCHVAGVDVDERTIQRARQDYPQVTFYCGLVQNLVDQMPKADVVIVSAIIEHVIDPADFLMQVSRVLKPGGQLFLLTPNAGSLHYWIARSWWRELLAVGEHVYLFTPCSLKVCVRRAGLHVNSLATDYDQLLWPKFSFPRNLKSTLILPWSYLRSALKAICMALPHGSKGDILFASVERDQENS